jgi:phosphoribosylformylglycinamidine (FGAM) synthase-like enzyme
VARREEARGAGATGPRPSGGARGAAGEGARGAHVDELIVLRNDAALYSESAGRLLVTVPADQADRFEKRMAGHAMAPIGQVVAEPRLRIRGVSEEPLIELPIPALWEAWKRPFGHLL